MQGVTTLRTITPSHLRQLVRTNSAVPLDVGRVGLFAAVSSARALCPLGSGSWFAAAPQRVRVGRGGRPLWSDRTSEPKCE